ncbi:MAG: transposase, partial [SAR324 cluster bacterium]|nr:transposase [SAR324 cluster bacterium]
MENGSETRDVFVGIDVSKARLDVAVSPTEKRWSVAQSPEDHAALARRIKEIEPALVVLEATGGLEMPIAAELAALGLQVAIVNPRQARDFAKAAG